MEVVSETLVPNQPSWLMPGLQMGADQADARLGAIQSPAWSLNLMQCTYRCQSAQAFHLTCSLGPIEPVSMGTRDRDDRGSQKQVPCCMLGKPRKGCLIRGQGRHACEGMSGELHAFIKKPSISQHPSGKGKSSCVGSGLPSVSVSFSVRRELSEVM